MVKKIFFFVLCTTITSAFCNTTNKTEKDLASALDEVKKAITLLSDQNLKSLDDYLNSENPTPEEFLSKLEEMSYDKKIVLTTLVSVAGATIIITAGTAGIVAISAITAAEIARRKRLLRKVSHEIQETTVQLSDLDLKEHKTAHFWEIAGTILLAPAAILFGSLSGLVISSGVESSRDEIEGTMEWVERQCPLCERLCNCCDD